MLNRITLVRWEYLKPFNSVQTNELWLVLKMLQTICFQILYFIYMYEQDLVLNDLQGLICCKTPPTNPFNNGHFFAYCHLVSSISLLCKENAPIPTQVVEH